MLDDVILFVYKFDEIAKKLDKDEDVIEFPNKEKENFAKHEWKDGELIRIIDSKYAYDFGITYGDCFIYKFSMNDGETIYYYNITEDSLTELNEFAEHCNELETKNK